MEQPAFRELFREVGTSSAALLPSAPRRCNPHMRVFQMAADQSADGILLLENGATGDPVVVYANPAFEAMTGYCAADVLETPAIRLLRGADRSGKIQGALRGAVKMGCKLNFEAANDRKDGSVFVADISFSPIRQAEACTHWFVILRDVTASRRR